MTTNEIWQKEYDKAVERGDEFAAKMLSKFSIDLDETSEIIFKSECRQAFIAEFAEGAKAGIERARKMHLGEV